MNKYIIEYSDIIVEEKSKKITAKPPKWITGVKQYNYSPEQPRDDSGKWSKGGGSISSKHANYTPNEYQDYVKKEYGNTTTFSRDEIDEITEYTDSSYQYTNADLVEGNKLDDYRKVTVKTLDKSMRHKLKEDTPLYRGIKVGTGTGFNAGDTIKYKGYSSTSINEESAKKFMQDSAKSGAKYLMKINAKKGQKGIFTILAQNTSYDKSLAAQEQEFLLPRNLGMKVDRINKKQGYWELEMSIL